MKEKLVRDNTQDIEKFEHCKFRNASTVEQLYFLAAKIKEDANKVHEAMYRGSRAQIADELADLLEVIETVCDWADIKFKSVQNKQDFKRKFIGSYKSFTLMEI